MLMFDYYTKDPTYLLETQVSLTKMGSILDQPQDGNKSTNTVIVRQFIDNHSFPDVHWMDRIEDCETSIVV